MLYCINYNNYAYAQAVVTRRSFLSRTPGYEAMLIQFCFNISVKFNAHIDFVFCDNIHLWLYLKPCTRDYFLASNM